MSKPIVAVLSGGQSNERAVSLVSGKNVAAAIPTDRYTVVQYDPKDQLADFLQAALAGNIDVVFPVLHGRFGEDGTIQGLCEMLALPYVGPNVFCSALCMDKEATKRLVMTHGMLTPEFELFDRNQQIDFRKIQLPCVIKPGNAGSSVGVTIPESFADLQRGMAVAFEHSQTVIVERFIKGKEYTVGVIGSLADTVVLPPIEIIPQKGSFYDYASKYEDGGSTHLCPAPLTDDLRTTLENLTRRTFKAVKAHGMLRVDFMFESDTQLFYFIEANTIPGMTNTSLLPEAARVAGIPFPQLLDRLIQLALER
ncbi:MAG: D-alanine--D-alanine ligase [Candidatus Kerfeldbacteria bacterium]|nr:D-alanine--D-alanine ligase [Candidatus Kerfeldbacteria bacterium]